MDQLADDALAVARRWHGDVCDKLGEDYVSGHFSRVQRTVANRGGDLVTQIAAALHDTLEDTMPRRRLWPPKAFRRRRSESWRS